MHALAQGLLAGDEEHISQYAGLHEILKIQVAERLREGINPPPLPPELPLWLQQLGADSHAEREEATDRLKALGSSAYQPLKDFRDANRSDPEILFRCYHLLSFTHPLLHVDLLSEKIPMRIARTLSPIRRLPEPMAQDFRPVYEQLLQSPDFFVILDGNFSENPPATGQIFRPATPADAVSNLFGQMLATDELRPLLRERILQQRNTRYQILYFGEVLGHALLVDPPFPLEYVHGFQNRLHAMLKAENRERVSPAQWEALAQILPLWHPVEHELRALIPFAPLPPLFDSWLEQMSFEASDPIPFLAMGLMRWTELPPEDAVRRQQFFQSLVPPGRRHSWTVTLRTLEPAPEDAWLLLDRLLRPSIRPFEDSSRFVQARIQAPHILHLFARLQPMPDEDILERLANPAQSLFLAGMVATHRPSLAPELLQNLQQSLSSAFSHEKAVSIGRMLGDYHLQAPPADARLTEHWRNWVRTDPRTPFRPEDPRSIPFGSSPQEAPFEHRQQSPFRYAHRLGIAPKVILEELLSLDTATAFAGDPQGLASVWIHLLRQEDRALQLECLQHLPGPGFDFRFYVSLEAAETLWREVLLLDPALAEDLAAHQARVFRRLTQSAPKGRGLLHHMHHSRPPPEQYANLTAFFSEHENTLRGMAADDQGLRDLAPLAAWLTADPQLRAQQGDFLRSIVDRVDLWEKEPPALRAGLAFAALLLEASFRTEWTEAIREAFGPMITGDSELMRGLLTPAHRDWLPAFQSCGHISSMLAAIRISLDTPAVELRVRDFLQNPENMEFYGWVLKEISLSGRTVHLADWLGEEEALRFLQVEQPRLPPLPNAFDPFASTPVPDDAIEAAAYHTAEQLGQISMQAYSLALALHGVPEADLLQHAESLTMTAVHHGSWFDTVFQNRPALQQAAAEFLLRPRAEADTAHHPFSGLRLLSSFTNLTPEQQAQLQDIRKQHAGSFSFE
mgnify:CR=1 FL=1